LEAFRESLIAWVLAQDEAALGRGLIELRREVESGAPSRQAVFNAAVSSMPE
jgi:hypothetical protein